MPTARRRRARLTPKVRTEAVSTDLTQPSLSLSNSLAVLPVIYLDSEDDNLLVRARNNEYLFVPRYGEADDPRSAAPEAYTATMIKVPQKDPLVQGAGKKAAPVVVEPRNTRNALGVLLCFFCGGGSASLPTYAHEMTTVLIIDDSTLARNVS